MLCDDCNENGEIVTSAAAVEALRGELLCSIPVSLILNNSLLEAIPELAEKPGAMQPKLEQHSTLFLTSSVLPR
jgi:hypothetical protein